VAGILAVPAFAQNVLEEVTVTAQRREEALQDVPVSITAFSAEALVRQNIREVKNYFQSTPNVNFTEDGEVGQRSVGISIRGVSDLTNTFTGVGGLPRSYAVYLDEFDIGNNATKTANPGLADLERLEVLRGPQGTYFGRNASGGALNLTTKLPHEGSEYELGLGYSRFNTWYASAMINQGITDQFFMRGVVYYEESEGFLTNLSATGNDDSYDYANVRVSARWVPTDQFTADLSVTRVVDNGGTDVNIVAGVSDFDTPGSTPNFLQVDPLDFFDPLTNVFAPFSELFPIDPGPGFYPDNRRYTNKDFFEINDNRQTIFNLRLLYEAEGWSVRTVTGVMQTTSRREFDQDLTQYSLYETYTGRTGDTWSQEVRFNIERDNWDLVIGGIYANEDVDDYGISPIGKNGFYVIPGVEADGTLPPGFNFPGDCFFCLFPGQIIAGPGISTFDLKSWAAFAEINWQATDQIRVTFGARYTDDKIKVVEADGRRDLRFHEQPLDAIFAFDQAAFINVGLRNPLRTGEASTDSISPRFVVAWAPNESVNTYASISRGYKPGGLTFNEETLEEVPFDPETLWNYEIGTKWRGLDNRVALNVAAFYMDWSGLHLPTVEIGIVPDGMGGQQIVNNFVVFNTDATSMGFEIDGEALVSEGWRIGGGVGYLNSEFDGFPADAPFVINDVAFALKGETIPRSPKWTINAFAQYDFTLSEKDAWFRVEWSHRSSIESDIEATVSFLEIIDPSTLGPEYAELNDSINGIGGPFDWPRAEFPLRVPSYDVVNIRAGIEGENWALTAYVENVFDKNYYTGTQENFGLGGFRIRPHFAIWGLSLRLFSSN
jgi:iron complex outermembrane receptor protein